jgi:hypothetical protein
MTTEQHAHEQQVTELHIARNIWNAVEHAFPFARENPRTALAFLLGVAVGALRREEEPRSHNHD